MLKLILQYAFCSAIKQILQFEISLISIFQYNNQVVDVTSQHDDWLNGKIWRENDETAGMFPANHVKNV